MRKKFQGIFLAITLLLGAASLPINSDISLGFNQAHAVEVGVEAETKVEVEVGSKNNSTTSESKKETKSEMKSETYTEIEVNVSGNKAIIEIEMGGEEKTFVLDTSSEAEIIAKIKTETSLTESEIKSIWKFNNESEGKMKNSAQTRTDLETKIQAKIGGITDVSVKAKERAKILISSMEEKKSDTNERFHEILLKAKAKGYLRTNTSSDASVQTYGLNLNGMAESQSETSSTMEGALYLETMKKSSNVSTYRVSGGQITIDGENYDVLFGKARATSTSDTKAESKMILVAEVMKPNGEVTTMKLLMEKESSINSTTETSSWSVMNPQSKIAGSWKMDADATMTLTSA